VREGRKRLVRRMLEAVGLQVERLVRVRLGPLRLGELQPGQGRWLDPEEVRALQRYARERRP
jgi:23S rRNA pseudouridine2605 synthase